jgi:hypothetical protein
MTPKDPKNLTNSPSTATDGRSQDVQGPPSGPGQHERADADRMTKSGRQRRPPRTEGGDSGPETAQRRADRLTKEGYEAGLRTGDPKA